MIKKIWIYGFLIAHFVERLPDKKDILGSSPSWGGGSFLIHFDHKKSKLTYFNGRKFSCSEPFIFYFNMYNWCIEDTWSRDPF